MQSHKTNIRQQGKALNLLRTLNWIGGRNGWNIVRANNYRKTLFYQSGNYINTTDTIKRSGLVASNELR